MRLLSRRHALGLALTGAATPFLVAADAEPKTEDFTGKVVNLAPLLEKFGAKLDTDAAPFWLALQGAEGKLTPLIKDDGSRMFFLDKRLLDRPMQLTGRLHPQSRMLQVLTVHSILKGQLCEVYYWCNVCSIRRSEKKACDCCGGPMELHEEPVKK
jgi:hypothetical protein